MPGHHDDLLFERGSEQVVAGVQATGQVSDVATPVRMTPKRLRLLVFQEAPGLWVVRGLVIVGLAYMAFTYFVPIRQQPSWITEAKLMPMVQDTAPAVTVQTPCVELAERTVSPATAGSDRVDALRSRAAAYGARHPALEGRRAVLRCRASAFS